MTWRLYLPALLCVLGGCDRLWGDFAHTRPIITCVDASECRDFEDVPLCAPGQDGRKVCTPCTEVPLEIADRECGPGRVCANGPGLDKGAGFCTQCRDRSHCDQSRGEACWHGACVPSCAANKDCPSKACDLFPALTPGRDAPPWRGACTPIEEVRYVDLTCDSVSAERTGRWDSRYCTLKQAMDSLDSYQRRTLRLMASHLSYGRLEPRRSRMPQQLTVQGPDEGEGPRAILWGSAALVGFPVSLDAVTVPPGMSLVLDRIDVQRALRGVYCNGETERTRVALLRSRLLGPQQEGLHAESCSVTLERSQIQGSGESALTLLGDLSYQVQNSFIVDNGGGRNPVVRLDGGAKGTFRFNTLVNNRSQASATISCGQVEHQIESSLLVRNISQDASLRSQVVGRCVLSRVVADDDTPLAQRGLPDFINAGIYGDYRLADTAASRSCCADKAPATVGYDYDGMQRPAGAAADIGASELNARAPTP